jgi:hypothetical protein
MNIGMVLCAKCAKSLWQLNEITEENHRVLMLPACFQSLISLPNEQAARSTWQCRVDSVVEHTANFV